MFGFGLNTHGRLLETTPPTGNEEYTSALKGELDGTLRRQRELEDELATTRTDLAAAREQLVQCKKEREGRTVSDALGHLDGGDDVVSPFPVRSVAALAGK